jgi:hypothetical protein
MELTDQEKKDRRGRRYELIKRTSKRTAIRPELTDEQRSKGHKIIGVALQKNKIEKRQ